MRAFACQRCGQLVFFENTECLRCHAPLGVLDERNELVALAPAPEDPDRLVAVAEPAGRRWRRCANAGALACNWLVPADAAGRRLCASCRLTTTRPNDADAPAVAAWAAAEGSKRRLLFQLRELHLPVVSHHDDPARGLSFELLAARGGRRVVTGHADGVITVDLAESDDAHRERVRLELGEPYRTVLGHFRHEIGHHYWP